MQAQARFQQMYEIGVMRFKVASNGKLSTIHDATGDERVLQLNIAPQMHNLSHALEERFFAEKMPTGCGDLSAERIAYLPQRLVLGLARSQVGENVVLRLPKSCSSG